MKLDAILKLVDAGYSKADIETLLEPSKAAESAATVQNAVPEETHEGVSPMAAADPFAEKISQLGSALDLLEKKIQGINLIQAQMNPEMIRQETPEDLIARIINPNSKKEV